MDRKQPEGGIPLDQPVIIGKIIRPHGVRGELKILSLSDVAGTLQSMREVVIEFKDGHTEPHSIYSLRGAGETILKLEGVGTREDALRFAGSYVVIPRSHLPKLEDDRYYVSDLIGMRVVDSGGNPAGSVLDVESYPANDVLVIRGDKGDIMVPAVREYVLRVDMAGKTITIRIPEVLSSVSPNQD